MEVNEVGKSAQKKLMSFLSDKPMWAFWIAYSVLSGVLFGIFYTAMYLMVLQWWIPVVIIIGIGMIWGSFAYVRESREAEAVAAVSAAEEKIKEEVKAKAKK